MFHFRAAWASAKHETRYYRSALLLSMVALAIACSSETRTSTSAVSPALQSVTPRGLVSSPGDSASRFDAATESCRSVDAAALPSEGSIRIVSWNVQGRFGEESRARAQNWHAGIVLLNEQEREKDHASWVRQSGAPFDFYGDGHSVAASVPGLQLLQPLTHADFRGPIVHLRWTVANEDLHLFSLRAQTPLNSASRHLKFLREADQLVDALGEATQHRRTIIAGTFNARSPLDGETEYVHSVARLLHAGYVDTFAAKHSTRREATKLHGKNRGHRVDYVFVSKDLQPALVAAGIDTTTSHPQHSDHRPVWADFDFSRLTASASR